MRSPALVARRGGVLGEGMKTLSAALISAVAVLISGCAQAPSDGIPPMKRGLAQRWQDVQRLHAEGKISDAQFYDMKFQLQAEEDAIDREGQRVMNADLQYRTDRAADSLRNYSRGGY
jgi:hypothetical protein